MKKLFRNALCAALMAAALSTSAFAADKAPAQQGDFSVLVNGSYVTFTDAVPQIRNSRSCLPFAAVLKQLGFADDHISWNGETRTVTADKDGVSVALTIGQKSITVTRNGKTETVTTDVAPYIDAKTSRTYVPLGLVADVLGYQVGWDADDKTVVIDDVDAILAANTETYTIMDKYLAYGRSFSQENQQVDGSYSAYMIMGGEKNGTEVLVDGDYQMALANNDAFQFNTTMALDMTVKADGKDVTADALEGTDLKLPLNVDLDLRGSLTGGQFYFQSAALTKLLGQDGLSNTWFKLDLASLLKQADAGFDYSDLTKLLASAQTDDFKTYLANTLRTMPLTDRENTVSDVLAAVNALVGDSAFTKSGSSYVNSVTLDGVKLSLTITTNGDKVNGYDLEVTGTDAETGSAMSITASMKDKKMEASFAVTTGTGDEEVGMALSMDGTYQSAKTTPVTTPPAGAPVVDLGSLIGLA